MVKDVFPNWTPWLTAPGRDCSWEGFPDSDGLQTVSSLDARGRELPDPVPLAPPVGMSQGPSLADFVQRMIKQEVSRAAAAAEMETFEESDDFDIEDDPIDPLTSYEKVFEPKPIPEDWPMYYNDKTGLYGQLPPGEKAPEGFVLLEREKPIPKGYKAPRRAQARGEGGAKPPTGQSSSPGRPLKGARVPLEEPPAATDEEVTE